MRKIIFLAFLLTFSVAGAGVASTITLDLGQTLIPYANQGSIGAASYDHDTGILTFEGDTWQALTLNTPITSDSIVSFDFRSDLQGEIHGIGFDSNTNFVAEDSKNFFHLYGTQKREGPWWVANDQYSYLGATHYPDTNGWVRYTIPLSGLTPGIDFNYLIFVNDNDKPGAQNNVHSEFRNFTVTSVPVPAAAWLLGAGLLGLIGIRRKTV
jgi:hypothetical protein